MNNSYKRGGFISCRNEQASPISVVSTSVLPIVFLISPPGLSRKLNGYVGRACSFRFVLLWPQQNKLHFAAGSHLVSLLKKHIIVFRASAILRLLATRSNTIIAPNHEKISWLDPARFCWTRQIKITTKASEKSNA